jgi:hypothetical protein
VSGNWFFLSSEWQKVKIFVLPTFFDAFHLSHEGKTMSKELVPQVYSFFRPSSPPYIALQKHAGTKQPSSLPG